MEIRLKKQAQKYLAKVDTKTRDKLYRALDGLTRLEGNIVKLKGRVDLYRLKLDHYRIIFEYDPKRAEIIVVIAINTRTNTNY